jgi:tripartite-type tricarboxylate transporter receptor subunit TctC
MRHAFVVALATSSLLLAAPVMAQTWPSERPITIVIPYPPGGGSDATVRPITDKLKAALGQTIVVENRGGASGMTGSEYVARAKPDGYTILLGTVASHALNLFLFKKVPYDPVKDFAQIAPGVNTIVSLAVHSSVPANNVAEFIAYAKANPGKLSFGSSGNGSPHHIGGELLNSLAGIDMVHVPYRGGGPATADLVGGQIPAAFLSIASVQGYLASGRAKVLGVLETKRYRAMPNIPRIGETVPGAELDTWNAFFAPAGTPPDIIAKLNAVIVTALQSDDLKEQFDAAGIAPIGGSPDDLRRMQEDVIARMGPLSKKIGLVAE